MPANVIERDRWARIAFDRWAPLLTSGAIDQARVLCEAWLNEPDRGHHAEAHKCLANIVIATSHGAVQRGTTSTGSSNRSRITRAGSDAAVAHYVAALGTKPLDIAAHVGRVDVLIVAGRFRDANAALDDSLEVFASRALLGNWFKLLGRFRRMGAIDEGLAFLQVIERHHPLDHRVVSNLGAYYAMTGKSDEALEYSQRAVSINPDDPINKWNLARIYDRQGRLDDADRQYQEALALFGDQDPRAHCDYAEFVATRLGDPARACDFAESQCKELYQRNCVAEDQPSGESIPGKG